jgi:hypothetical protein
LAIPLSTELSAAASGAGRGAAALWDETAMAEAAAKAAASRIETGRRMR